MDGSDDETRDFPQLPPYLDIDTKNESPCMEIMTSYKTFPNIEIFKQHPRRKRLSFSLVMQKRVVLAAALLFQFEYDEGNSGVCLPYMTTRFGFRSYRLGELLLNCIKVSLHKSGVIDIYVPATPQAISFWKRNGCVPVTLSKCHPAILEACQVFTGTTLLLLKTARNDPFPPIPAKDELKRLFHQAKRFSIVATSPIAEALNAVQEGAKDSIRGWTLMHECVQRKDKEEAYKLTFTAIKHGGEVNAVESTFRQTPLFFAANTGEQQLVKLLVQNKASPHHRDANSQLALFYAAKHNSLDIIRYFVEKCDVPANAIDAYKRSALTYAMEENRQGSHDEVIRYLKENSKNAQTCPEPPLLPAHARRYIRTTQQSKRAIEITASATASSQRPSRAIIYPHKCVRMAHNARRITSTTTTTTTPSSPTSTTITSPIVVTPVSTPTSSVRQKGKRKGETSLSSSIRPKKKKQHEERKRTSTMMSTGTVSTTTSTGTVSTSSTSTSSGPPTNDKAVRSKTKSGK